MVKPLFSMALAAVAVTGASGTHSVWAQPAGQTQMFPEQPALLPVADGKKMRPMTMRVRNLPASFLAWMVDPGNNEMPPQYRLSDRNATGMFPQPEKKPLRSLLPEGVERVVAIDPQNALLVFGTEDGYEALRQMIEARDKPLPQVAVEVRYYKVSEEEVKKLPITAAPEGAVSGPFSMGIGGNGLAAQMDELVKAKKATVITAPRVTAISGLTAALRSGESYPAQVNSVEEDSVLEVPQLHSKDKGYVFGVNMTIGITVKPTIQDDGTVSLKLAPGRVLELNEGRPYEPLWRRNLDGIVDIKSMNDGETVALMGGTTEILSGVRDRGIRPSNLLILVKTSLIRRAE